MWQDTINKKINILWANLEKFDFALFTFGFGCFVSAQFDKARPALQCQSQWVE